MAEICRDVVSEGEGTTTSTCKPPASLSARRRRMELRRIKFAAENPTPTDSDALPKRPRLSPPRSCDTPVSDGCHGKRVGEREGEEGGYEEEEEEEEEEEILDEPVAAMEGRMGALGMAGCAEVHPKYGMASVCGRRRDMEDAVAIHLSFCRSEHGTVPELHYFGVYDGHGCSHVATRCRDRLHELVKEELENKEEAWKSAMERSFSRMDKEVVAWNKSGSTIGATCRCELRTPDSDAVGSTAVTVVVTSNKIIVANCGDSRAVLCRGGRAVPLSTDHKPDRPDELSRIQAAGGRVIYWDGPRVLGVLAMSRAIGDNYLKPYVSSEPEVTETNRSAEDECLILASDGLWDVVTNETACRVARMCLKGHTQSASSESSVTEERETDGGGGERNIDKACSDASMLLTKLALARRSTDNVSVVVIDLRRDT